MPKEIVTNDNWDKLKDDAITVIRDYLGGEGEVDTEDMRRVKIATSVLSSYTRHEQTESAREAVSAQVGRQVYENADDFAEYIRKTCPRLGTALVAKALVAGES